MIMTKEKHQHTLAQSQKHPSGSPKRYAENLEAEIKRDHISFQVNHYIYSIQCVRKQ